MKRFFVIAAAVLCGLAAWVPEHATALPPDYWKLSDSWRFGAAI